MNVIQFKSIDEFIQELRDESASIADRTVRFQAGRTPENTDEISFEVDVWGTAILNADEKYLLEYGEAVGFDREEHNNSSSEGTDRMMAIKSKLREACDDLGLKFKSGKIEVF